MANIVRIGGGAGGGTGLNIDFGLTAPADTSKLWVPLAHKPDNVEISGDSLQSALDTIENMGAVLSGTVSGCMTTAVHGGKIYSFGYNTVDVYDPVADTVTRKTLTLPNSISSPAAVSIGDSIYLLGGANSNSYGTNYVHKYNPETNVGTDTGARLPTAIYYAPVVAINGKAYIFGGRTYSYYGTFYNCIQEYDPVTNTCTTKKAVLTGTNCGASATVINGKAYIFGGWNNNTFYNTIQEYDPTTDTCVVKSAKLQVGMYLTSASSANGKAYIFGGTNTQNGSTNASFNYIQEYDPVTDTRVLSTLNLTANAWSASSATLNNIIYVLGVGSSRKDIKRFVAKAYLGANNLKLFASVYRSVSSQIITNIVNGKNEQIKLYMTSAFLGGDDGYAMAQEAYVYNASTGKWQSLDGTSMTTDMLAALAELGVS